MENIKDYARYTSLMREGFYDKLFFIDKLFGSWNSLLDYGCADGFLTKMIAEIFPDKRIRGYDSSEDMIRAARTTGSLPENVLFYNATPHLPTDVLLLSSVIHELYTYNPEKIEAFWKFVFRITDKYVVIRDMLYDNDTLTQLHTRIPFIKGKIEEWCKINNVLGELRTFESIFGSISNPKAFVHFLLKYPYISSPNWKREVSEDYLACSLQEVKSLIPPSFQVVYQESSALPFLKHKWFEDFGEIIEVKTHSKLIIQKWKQ